MGFEGLKALVTGGSNGIGAAIGKMLVEEGAEVIVFDQEEPGYEAEYHSVDVRDHSQIEEAFGQIEELDILVNNAGVYEQVLTENTEPEQLDKMVDTNFKGYYTVAKHALPLLKENEGSIVNISSGLGESPEPYSPAYSATKAAINSLTDAWAQKYASDNIRVNAVLPGPIHTDMLHGAFDSEEELDEYRELNPLGKIGEPEDVARAVLYLADPGNDFVTGAKLPVDGGESVGTVYTE